MREKKPNKDFDGVFYKYHYDDVEINPLIHYALYGIDENRQIKVANEDLANFNDLNKTNILFVLHEKNRNYWRHRLYQSGYYKQLG